MPVNTLASKLTNTIKSTMSDALSRDKDQTSIDGDEISKLYFKTLADVLNEYLTENVSIVGAFAGVSTSSPPIAQVGLATFKCEFNINGEVIRSLVKSASEETIRNNGEPNTVPTQFALGIYNELVKQTIKAKDETGACTLTFPAPLKPLKPLSLSFDKITDYEDFNRALAIGVFTCLTGSTIAVNGPNCKAIAPITQLPAHLGTVTFSGIIVA